MKHAYLIIAHKDDYTFRTLLRLLDDSRNDIFIHMDKKTKQYDFNDICSYIKHSRIYQVECRNSVSWGGYSLVDTEMQLLKLATDTGKYN